MRNEKDVRDKSRLQHNGHVRGVKELDRVRSLLATELVRFDRNLNAEALEVNHNGKNEDSRQKVREIGEVRSIHSLFEGSELVLAGEKEMK